MTQKLDYDTKIIRKSIEGFEPDEFPDTPEFHFAGRKNVPNEERIDTDHSEILITRLSFFAILIMIVIAWVLITFWTRFLDNLWVSLGMSLKSTYHTFIIALLMTVFFLVAIEFMEPLPGFVDSLDMIRTIPPHIKGAKDERKPKAIRSINIPQEDRLVVAMD